MAIRNILNEDGNIEKALDTYFNTTTTTWSGAGSTTAQITFARSNDLCIIRIAPFTIPTATATGVFTSSVTVPPNMIPKDG